MIVNREAVKIANFFCFAFSSDDIALDCELKFFLVCTNTYIEYMENNVSSVRTPSFEPTTKLQTTSYN